MVLAGREGHTIGTKLEAERFDAAVREHPASWAPRSDDREPIRVGETLLLESCVGAGYEAVYGKVCPRVELWPENAPAARIVFAALPMHTRPLLPAVVDAIAADLEPDEARRSVLLALEVLHGRTVNDWMRRQLAAPASDGD